MKHICADTPEVRRTIHKDAHDPTVYIETVTKDQKQLRNNEIIRNERLLQRDARHPMMEGGVIAFSFTFPTYYDYSIVVKAEPELMDVIVTGTEAERIRAAEKLEILYPQYVTTVRRRDARRT